MRGDRDSRRQTDLRFAHVGQRLFEMLGGSGGMALRQLAAEARGNVRTEEIIVQTYRTKMYNYWLY